MKKIILIIITVVTMLGISACGDKQSNQSTVTDDYRYSSYTYDDNAPQYYMAGSAAASETGYYYIDGAPVINNSNMYIMYLNFFILSFCLTKIKHFAKLIIYYRRSEESIARQYLFDLRLFNLCDNVKFAIIK